MERLFRFARYLDVHLSGAQVTLTPRGFTRPITARHLFLELERAQSRARQLDIEWAQLQLDQSTLGKHARIEDIAHRDLGMTQLTPARTQYLTEGEEE